MYSTFTYLKIYEFIHADPSGRAVKSVGVRPLAFWDCGFESRRKHGCLSVVSVVRCCRGLCDELITRPEDSYRLWCVDMRSKNLKNEKTMASGGPQRQGGDIYIYIYIYINVSQKRLCRCGSANI
jgi:hypothetical protein